MKHEFLSCLECLSVEGPTCLLIGSQTLKVDFGINLYDLDPDLINSLDQKQQVKLTSKQQFPLYYLEPMNLTLQLGLDMIKVYPYRPTINEVSTSTTSKVIATDTHPQTERHRQYGNITYLRYKFPQILSGA